jgi:HSP20 family molecular chaperone IbpA
MMQQMKPEEINQYVQDMMGKMFGAHSSGMFNPQDLMKHAQSTQNPNPQKESSLITSVFETHDYVFVRITINNEEWLKQLRIYHTSNTMIIEHIPELTDKHTLILPAIVKKKGASARFKDGMLEVRVPKNTDMQFSEIEVTETF